MNTSIPVYKSDGTLYSRVTIAQLARLESAGVVARVVRRRKGHINRVILGTRASDPTPTRAWAYMGTRYSTREHLAHGRAWELKHLDGTREEKRYAPAELRPVFQRVVADCIRTINANHDV